jgi:hypothetical protein
MKRISIIALCVMAVVALSAITASTAAAEETEEKAPAAALFKFTNGNISEGGTFAAKGSSTDELATKNIKVVCTGGSTTESNSFEKEFGAHLGHSTIVFSGCSVTILGIKIECENESLGKGKVRLLNWQWHLGWAWDPFVRRWLPVLAFLFPGVGAKEPEPELGKFEFKCGSTTVTVTGNFAVGALYKTGTKEPVALKEKRSSVELVYQALEGKEAEIKPLFTLFYLPLTNKIDRIHVLEAENSTTKTKEEAVQISKDTIEKFENVKKEATEIELVEG